MGEREIIRLDARLVGVLSDSAFCAELPNGHRLTAYARRADRARATALRPGMWVRLEISPCDFSRGRLLFGEEDER